MPSPITRNTLLNSEEVKMLPAYGTFKQAEKIKKEDAVQGELGMDSPD
jgi:hypothetical protein